MQAKASLAPAPATPLRVPHAWAAQASRRAFQQSRGGLISSAAPQRSQFGCGQRNSTVVAAKNWGWPERSAQEKNEDEGFRFDEARQIWVADPRYKGRSMTLVRPKSGIPYTVWPVMHSYLTKKGLKSVDQQQATDLVKSGKAVLVDVRLAEDFAVQHAAGAINVPMFRITAGNSGWDKAKRVAMAALFMKPTERDPDFLKNFEKRVPRNKKVIIMCAVGGTLDKVVKVESTGKSCNDPERNFGRETRSLKACYELLKGGWKDVVHLKGGLSAWRYEGFPTASGKE